MMAKDYGIPCNSISVRNSQANAIMERVHQTIGNIIRTFKIQEIDLETLTLCSSNILEQYS